MNRNNWLQVAALLYNKAKKMGNFMREDEGLRMRERV